METKQYKNLGNVIRESVFNAKEAPTMLPDETIEKLGLGEDDILSMENDNDDDEDLGINEALRHGKDSFALRKTAEELATQLASQIGDMHLPDSDSVRYEQPGKNFSHDLRRGKLWKKDEANATKQLDKIISQLESLLKLVSRSTL